MTAFAQFRAPTAEEFPIGIAELGKLIGAEEATSPSWTRRLVLAHNRHPDTGRALPEQWALVLDDGIKTDGLYTPPWKDDRQVQAIPTAFPMEEAIGVLRGPDDLNCEQILAKRRKLVADHRAEEAAAHAAKLEAEERVRQEAEQEKRDRQRFDDYAWNKLDVWQKAFYSLALQVQERDGELAADLRAVAAKGGPSGDCLPFPRCRWKS